MSVSDDLSDVIPIGVTIAISDGVQEMKFGKRICEIRGYGENGWTNEMMLDYFTDLCRVYDAWAESKQPWVMPERYEDLVLPADIRDTGMNMAGRLAAFVLKAYDHFCPKSISEILMKLDVSVAEFHKSLTVGRKPTHDLTAMALCEMERTFTRIHPNQSINELSALTGFTRGQLERFRDIFANRRLALHGEEALKVDRAPELLRQLVRDGKYKNHECLKMVYDATGIKYSKSYVSKIRKEME